MSGPKVKIEPEPELLSKPNIKVAEAFAASAIDALNDALRFLRVGNIKTGTRTIKTALDFTASALAEIAKPCEIIKALPATIREELLGDLPLCLSDIYLPDDQERLSDPRFGYAELPAEEMLSEAITALKLIATRGDMEKAKEALKEVIRYATDALIEIGGTVKEAHEAVESVKMPASELKKRLERCGDGGCAPVAP